MTVNEDAEALLVRRVAEAARELRAHQLKILDAMKGGDLKRQRYDDRSAALISEQDEALARWREFGETNSAD